MEESKAEKLVLSDPKAFLELTRERLVRVYPRGTRVASDNLDPVMFWACGVQLAALNAQTRALETDLNDALFRDNGGIGFVLKPPLLLDRAHSRALVLRSRCSAVPERNGRHTHCRTHEHCSRRVI